MTNKEIENTNENLYVQRLKKEKPGFNKYIPIGLFVYKDGSLGQGDLECHIVAVFMMGKDKQYIYT